MNHPGALYTPLLNGQIRACKIQIRQSGGTGLPFWRGVTIPCNAGWRAGWRQMQAQAPASAVQTRKALTVFPRLPPRMDRLPFSSHSSLPTSGHAGPMTLFPREGFVATVATVSPLGAKTSCHGCKRCHLGLLPSPVC